MATGGRSSRCLVVGRNRGQPVVACSATGPARRPGSAATPSPNSPMTDRRSSPAQLGRAGGERAPPRSPVRPAAVGKVVGPAAHVDPARRRRTGQRRRQLTHADVHAAGVAGAESGEVWRRRRQEPTVRSIRSRRKHSRTSGPGADPDRAGRATDEHPPSGGDGHVGGFEEPDPSGSVRRTRRGPPPAPSSKLVPAGTTGRCAPGSSSAPR